MQIEGMGAGWYDMDLTKGENNWKDKNKDKDTEGDEEEKED